MHRFACLLSVSALGAAALAQTSPGVITPLVPYNANDLGAAVINSTVVSGEIINVLEQLELRSLGGGVYRCTVTAITNQGGGSKLVTGLLNLATTPPGWTPLNDLELLNTPGASTDEFQCSISQDGLICVWDNYLGYTYPNTVLGSTFICRRTSTSVQFNPNDVRVIIGVPSGGVDPHIGEELPNGNVVVYFFDINGDISKGEVDPGTGTLTNQSLAVAAGGSNPNQIPGTVVFCHSPTVQRDGGGKARGLTYSEYISGSLSDGLWTTNVNNTGNRWCIAQRTINNTNYWFANPAVMGGTWAWATAAAGYGDPSRFEGVAVVDADIRGGGRLTAYAPIRPAAALPAYISAVGIGLAGPTLPPYQIPGVSGQILVYPVAILSPLFHDNQTGIGEAIFAPYTPFNAQYQMQVVTLDTTANTIIAGNVATLDY